MTDAEAMGRAFYLAMYEDDGAEWETNSNKVLWMRKARRYNELMMSSYLPSCLHPGNEPGSCQNQGGCQSEACDHYNKTEYRPRMTLLAQADGVLYPGDTK